MGAVMEYVNPVLGVLGGLSLPVKIAWGVWLLWGVGQLAWQFWPRHETRIYRTTASRGSGPRPVAVRPRKRVVAAPATAAPYGTSDFIAALDQEQQPVGGAPAGEPESSSPYR
jgi:hypothetical protein